MTLAATGVASVARRIAAATTAGTTTRLVPIVGLFAIRRLIAAAGAFPIFRLHLSRAVTSCACLRFHKHQLGAYEPCP